MAITVWMAAAVAGPGAPAEGRDDVTVQFSKALSLNGSTRATAYAMSNKIITAKGKVFVTWLDRIADVQMATYDVAKKQWTPPVLVGRGVDNHGGPAITMDSSGHLYVAYGPHHGPFQFRRSMRPYDASAWGPVQRFGLKATYPSLVCDGADTLHCTYRGGPKSWLLMYQQKPKGGRWSRPRVLVDPGGSYTYTQYGNPLAVAKDGTLHLAFHVYTEKKQLSGRGRALGYLRSRDGGATWETAAGEKVTLPATLKTDCFIERGAKLNLRVGDLVLDGAGRPWLAAWHIGTRPRTVLLWHHDGVRWRSRDLLPFVEKRLPGHELAMGTLTFDRDGVLYVAAVVRKAGGSDKTWFGHPTKEVALLTSVNGGKTFRVRPISTPDPTLPNWLPSIERPYGPRPIGVPSFLYTHGNKGTFGDCRSGAGTEVRFVRLAK